MIKAIIFDIDGVLIDSFEANLDFFQNLMNKTGYHPPTRAEYRTMFHRTMKEVIEILTKSKSEKEIQRIWTIGNKRSRPYDVSLIKLGTGLEDALKKLEKKYLLAIASGRVRNSIYEFPKLAKLKKHFKVAVAFEDTEKHKPNPEPLLFAANKLGLKPSECVYVGDVENDMKAAKAAGMKFIFYSKEKLKGADACTSSFKELPKVVANLK